MPTLSIVSDCIVIHANQKENFKASIIKKDQSNHSYDSSNDEVSKVSILISDIDIYNDDLYVNDQDVSGLLSRYKLDTSKLDDEFYMTKNLANAATRPYNNNELFFVAYQLLNILEPNNHFYASCISVCSYKYVELSVHNSFVRDFLVNKWYVLDNKRGKITPNYIRWYISSSMSLSLMLLASDDTDNAAHVVGVAAEKSSSYYGYNHLSYWNYCQLAFLYGALKVYKEDYNSASVWFMNSFNASRAGIADIYNPRNDWLLGQLSDCEALLKVGSLSLVCAMKANNGALPLESRSTQQVPKNKKIDINVLFLRLPVLKNKSLPFFDLIKSRLEGLT
ncbi:hypothetical protein [Cobetia sp. 1AS1]|uniref:hypothetical protein n=1 Tax=Cobetia sp. 1AS1 TaxID=3040016 RepID=UPI00244C0D08|nr:hypothetical protein [Cobetia sp. 1AS1]MDH2294247.1 hypothetical protein [Cobetia sp. 1AS1]